MVKNFEDIFIRFGATHERDRRTDRRTPHAGNSRAMHSIARHRSRFRRISGRSLLHAHAWSPFGDHHLSLSHVNRRQRVGATNDVHSWMGRLRMSSRQLYDARVTKATSETNCPQKHPTPYLETPKNIATFWHRPLLDRHVWSTI